MDIKVGDTAPITDPRQSPSGPQEAVEARLLAVRAPRRRVGSAPPRGGERRSSGQPRDPITGRVLVLLIPDGSRLPEGLTSGQYRVFLRFARR